MNIYLLDHLGFICLGGLEVTVRGLGMLLYCLAKHSGLDIRPVVFRSNAVYEASCVGPGPCNIADGLNVYISL